MEQFWRFWVFRSRLRGISWHLETNISLFIPLKLSGIKGKASWKHAGSVRLVSHSALATVRPQPLLPGVLFGFNCGNNKLPPPGVTSHTSPVCSVLRAFQSTAMAGFSLVIESCRKPLIGQNCTVKLCIHSTKVRHVRMQIGTNNKAKKTFHENQVSDHHYWV